MIILWFVEANHNLYIYHDIIGQGFWTRLTGAMILLPHTTCLIIIMASVAFVSLQQTVSFDFLHIANGFDALMWKARGANC